MITPAHVVAHVFEGHTIHHTNEDEAGIPVTTCGKPYATIPPTKEPSAHETRPGPRKTAG